MEETLLKARKKQLKKQIDFLIKLIREIDQQIKDLLVSSEKQTTQYALYISSLSEI